MVRPKTLPLFLTLLLMVGLSRAAEGMVIVSDGEARAAIVIPGTPSPTEQFAAEELQRYIGQMSGAELPIVSDEKVPAGAIISVGRTVIASNANATVESDVPTDDPYIVRAAAKGLILLGKGDRGTIYSVYYFLEKYLGCRWVFPGELGDIIPQRRTVEVGNVNDLCKPAFRFRICAGFNTPEGQDWAIKQRMHVYSPRPSKWNDEWMVKRGGYIKGTMHHAFHRLFPAEEYFAERPEYYGLIDGKRVASPNRGQLCLSNPDVVRRTAAKAIAFFDDNADAEFFSLCPDDHQNWCECENCTAFDSATMERWGRTYPIVSDRLMAFVNKVGEQLERQHPGKMLYVFAYQNYTSPPLKHMPRRNVIVGLCHMVPACYAHPLNDPNCEKNVEFTRLLTGWTDVHKNMWYYAYTCKSMWQDMPWPIARRLAKDIRFLHSKGFQGFYSQGSGLRWGQLGVNMYVMAKMLWDVDTDVEAVLNEYFDSSFGPAAQAMQSFYNLLEKEFSKPGNYIHHEAREQARQFLTPDVFAKCFSYLDSAREEAGGDANILARIEPVRIAFEYARLYLEADTHEKKFRETDSDEELGKAIAAYLDIIALQREHGAHAISSSGIGNYAKPPLEQLQMFQFARTGEAEGMSIKWEANSLLGNPSFEGGESGWSGLGASNRGSCLLTQEAARTGRRSLVMQAKKKTDVPDETGFWKADWVAANALGPKIPVKTGEIYRLMAWVNVPEEFTDTKRGVILNIVGYDEDGNSPARWGAGTIEVSRTKPTKGWERMAMFRKIDNKDVKYISPRLGIAGSGKVFFDDVELVRGSEDK